MCHKCWLFCLQLLLLAVVAAKRVEITVHVFLPDDKNYLASLSTTRPVIDVAFINARKRYLPDLHLDLRNVPTVCLGQSTVLRGAVDAVNGTYSGPTVLFLGPICDFSVATVSRIAYMWDKPLITLGGFAFPFRLKATNERNMDTHPRLTRLGGFRHHEMIKLIEAVGTNLSWTKVAFLREGLTDNQKTYGRPTDRSYCHLFANALSESIESNITWINVAGQGVAPDEDLKHFLGTEIGTEFGGISSDFVHV